MDGLTKEVYYNEWCHKCEHFESNDAESPCDECLYNPSNEYSHKPVNYIGKDS